MTEQVAGIESKVKKPHWKLRWLVVTLVATLAVFCLLWLGYTPDAIRDASSLGQLFERIEIKGFTDLQKNTGGTGLVDIDGDGLLDIVAVYTQGDKTLRVFQNHGEFQFTMVHERPLHGGPRMPNLIDFNNDGWLDIMVTHARGYEDNPGPGNALLVTQGGPFDWIDLGEQMGVRNSEAYNCGSSIGDIDGDGWLDIVIAADHIGNMFVGKPRQRLYRFVPNGENFEDGHFVDLGGTDQIPGYGGPVTCDADIDLGGPSSMLCDLDNDGDLDLLRLYHADMLYAAWDHPCASGEQFQGVYLWKNLLAETGEFRFERITDNGLAYSGRMFYDQNLGYYVPDPNNPDADGFNNMSVGDVNNDGLFDIIAVGSTDPQWNTGTEVARLWYNRGDLVFEEATSLAGLDSLNWTYFEWDQLWDYGLVENILLATPALFPKWTNQAPLIRGKQNGDMQPY